MGWACSVTPKLASMRCDQSRTMLACAWGDALANTVYNCTRPCTTWPSSRSMRQAAASALRPWGLVGPAIKRQVAIHPGGNHAHG